MKLVTHDVKPQILETSMQFDPLPIWLSGKIELVIEREDKLADVARVVREHWAFLTKDQARGFVAYWFALGERLSRRKMATGWKPKETRRSPGRRYLSSRSEDVHQNATNHRRR